MLDDNRMLDGMFGEIATAEPAPETRITLHIDSTGYKSKPTDPAAVNNRLAKIENQKTVTLAELGEAIKTGHSICIAKLDGKARSYDSFLSVQIIGMDIDNDEKKNTPLKKTDPRYLSLESALKLFADAGINVNAYYHSFRSSDECEKYRLLILLDKPCTDALLFKEIATALMRFCPALDQSCKEPIRYFFGSNNFTLLNNKPSSLEAVLTACKVEVVNTPQKTKSSPQSFNSTQSEQVNDVAEAVPYLYNTITSRNKWRNYGLAIASLGEAGRSAWIDLSSNQAGYSDSPEYLHKVYDDLLKSWKPGRKTHRSIIDDAMKNGWINNKARSSEDRAYITDNIQVEQIKDTENLPESQVEYLKNIPTDTAYSDPENINLKDYLLCSHKKATDHEIARALHKFNDGNFVYNHSRKFWCKWNCKHWQNDEKNEVKGSIILLAQECLKLAVNAPMTDQNRLLELKKELESVKNWGNISTAYSIISGEVDSKFNANKNLFNLSNGTYDLSKMQFREHKKTDYITDCMDYEYNATATCDRFLQFLDDTFAGNQNLISFLQRSIGYTLTGLSTEQHFLFLYGTGSNGKSVFIETMLKLLGSYSVKIPLASIMQTKNPLDAQRATSRFQNKRFAVCNEVEEGGRMAESTIKDLTGGDTLLGTAIFEKSIEFKPSHVLWIYGNHRIVIRGTDNGIWRRPLMIPFLQTVPEHKKDKFLISKLTKELSGIFNWALSGLQDWKKNGLQPPQEVTLSTAEYKSAMDLIGNFLAECTESATGINTSQKELYAAFKQWQIDSGDNSRVTSRALTTKLKERNMPNYEGAGGFTYWQDLQLRTD